MRRNRVCKNKSSPTEGLLNAPKQYQQKTVGATNPIIEKSSQKLGHGGRGGGHGRRKTPRNLGGSRKIKPRSLGGGRSDTSISLRTKRTHSLKTQKKMQPIPSHVKCEQVIWKTKKDSGKHQECRRKSQQGGGGKVR